MVEIYDDFLSEVNYNNILDLFLKNKNPNGGYYQVPWLWGDEVVPDSSVHVCDKLDNWQLYNVIYNRSEVFDKVCWETLIPLLEDKRLDLRSVVRIKANLNPRHTEIVKHGYHVDVPFECTTAIFYVNSNDGRTEFNDGQVIESKANRLITFPSTKIHSGTTCTNEKRRVVINFNYFKAPIDSRFSDYGYKYSSSPFY